MTRETLKSACNLVPVFGVGSDFEATLEHVDGEYVLSVTKDQDLIESYTTDNKLSAEIIFDAACDKYEMA